LAVAKYFALAGAIDEARTLFGSLEHDRTISSQQECDVANAISWLDAKDDRAAPHWPAIVSRDGTCIGAANGQQSRPEWPVTDDHAPADAAGAKTLLGFDIDPDVLSAGFEIIGTVRWRTIEGNIETEYFRTPNLWPNSSSEWLRLPNFTTCVPGYAEPPWVSRCASRTTRIDGRPTTIASGLTPALGATDAAQELPDAYLTTASANVPAGRTIVYGGRWRVEGSLPRPQIARSIFNDELPVGLDAAYRYQVLIDLHDSPASRWQTRVATISGPPRDAEYVNWIRPRSGFGDGQIELQDAFSFILPNGG
jgi:hypothetical protein